jgi:hypothetical protein
MTTWDIRRAMKSLDIDMIPFDEKLPAIDCRGYSYDRKVAIRPTDQHPVFVALHEMAHIMLGHTSPRFGNKITKLDVQYANANLGIQETLAHTVALTVAQAIGLTEWDVHRELGYLGHFMKAQRVPTSDEMTECFKVSNLIIDAGLEESKEEVNG